MLLSTTDGARKGRKRCKSAYPVHKAVQRTDGLACGSSLEQVAAHRHFPETKFKNKATDEAPADGSPSTGLQGAVWDSFRRPNHFNFTQIVINTAKQTHLGWLSIVMALELRRLNPSEGEHLFPYYLYEIYGLILEGVAVRIKQGFGSELVLAIMMLVFFETALHGCPEPAIHHLHGLEALLSERKSHPDHMDNNSQQLDHYALTVIEVARGAISARREFHPMCGEHSSSLFTWNVCVHNRPRLAHLRDYVAGILEVVRIDTLLTTDGWLEQNHHHGLGLTA